MKSRVTRILSIGIALTAAAAVHAQDKAVTANVPFSFYMGASPMPQGAYAVDEVFHGNVIAVKSKGAIKSVTTHEIAGKREIEPARLVFHCYGGNCFLAEVWTGDSGVGHALLKSTREKELARSGAGPTLALISLALHE